MCLAHGLLTACWPYGLTSRLPKIGVTTGAARPTNSMIVLPPFDTQRLPDPSMASDEGKLSSVLALNAFLYPETPPVMRDPLELNSPSMPESVAPPPSSVTQTFPAPSMARSAGSIASPAA